MQQSTRNWAGQDGAGHVITGRPVPLASVRPGPEFANNAYAACLRGVADKAQQRSVAAQLAIARGEIAVQRKALQDMDGWLANTGHDEDHPWRISIRAAIGDAS